MSVDKSAVREDYRRGLSMRMLSTKYGVPKSTIALWAKKYGWVQEENRKYVPIREQLDKLDEVDGVDTAVQSEPAGSGEYLEIRGDVKKLLGRVRQRLDSDKALEPRDLKSISSALLDVRTLLGALSPLEEEEQRLRLAAMRKQLHQEQQEEKAVTVRFIDTGEAEL